MYVCTPSVISLPLAQLERNPSTTTETTLAVHVDVWAAGI